MPSAPANPAAPYSPIPDDEEFIGILRDGSMYAEVTAFCRLAATLGVEQAYRKWVHLQRRARQQDDD